MPTLWEWLCDNGFYEQAEMYDANGNKVTSWYGNDPKYDALVLRIEPKYPEEPWICAKVFTNWKGE